MKKHTFKLPIGDWSGDGHGNVEWYRVQANKPVEDAREAYFAAKKKLPKNLCPESFCQSYQDSTLEADDLKAIRELGFNEPGDYMPEDKSEDWDDVQPLWMAQYLVWYLNQGDPDLKAVLLEEEEEMLPFYGFDKKRRHIGHIGYGLFKH